MRDFSGGIHIGVNEDEYQSSLQAYRDGLVVSLSRSRMGQFTLHKATCGTLSYDLAEKNSPTKQTRRSGKLLFRNHTELEAWLATKADLVSGELNRCSFCL